MKFSTLLTFKDLLTHNPSQRKENFSGKMPVLFHSKYKLNIKNINIWNELCINTSLYTK